VLELRAADALTTRAASSAPHRHPRNAVIRATPSFAPRRHPRAGGDPEHARSA
jgi:hypothetical protein